MTEIIHPPRFSVPRRAPWLLQLWRAIYAKINKPWWTDPDDWIHGFH